MATQPRSRRWVDTHFEGEYASGSRRPRHRFVHRAFPAFPHGMPASTRTLALAGDEKKQKLVVNSQRDGPADDAGRWLKTRPN